VEKVGGGGDAEEVRDSLCKLLKRAKGDQDRGWGYRGLGSTALVNKDKEHIKRTAIFF